MYHALSPFAMNIWHLKAPRRHKLRALRHGPTCNAPRRARYKRIRFTADEQHTQLRELKQSACLPLVAPAVAVARLPLVGRCNGRCGRRTRTRTSRRDGRTATLCTRPSHLRSGDSGGNSRRRARERETWTPRRSGASARLPRFECRWAPSRADKSARPTRSRMAHESLAAELPRRGRRLAYLRKLSTLPL
ncbi:hypothetical protein AWB75_03848 [Caballeronia catudaia]|uniref:Uncharacterized protein n=1 Tax=Caballeronia catudaia TaxID=1777136 RepID=A0A158BQ81_9BURK|nr:hypothetical protein AWB75_03848 [Caballeronia catudaia]